jgi:hypothetical protein
MWCRTLTTNAIATWTTEYHGLAVAALRQAGRPPVMLGMLVLLDVETKPARCPYVLRARTDV